MNKELTPLENFEYFIRCFAIDTNEELDTIKKLYAGTIKVIESALKRLNYIDENKIYCISENYLQDIKKLKAFKIIKEKGCSYMEIALIVSCKNYEEYCIEMNSGRVYSSGYECERAFKTQEEFDLLKEVLQ